MYKKKWKTATCTLGEKCWCRCVVTEDYKKEWFDDQMEYCVIPSQSVNKKLAQYIVKLHNENIK